MNKSFNEYAFVQYNLGHPDDFVENIQQSKNQTYLKTTIKAKFELGLFDDCRKLLEQYKEEHAIDDFGKDLIWTAEKVGLFEMVKEASSDDGALVVYKAHALLMTGEREKALSLYRGQINNYKNEIIEDFAVFRWLGFPDTEISIIEKELNLSRINVYTHPNDDNNTALATSFIGTWQCDENDNRIQWEIKDNHNLCHYLFQTKKSEKEWIDEDIAVTRYRLKRVDNKTIIEEYNSRSNVLSVSEIEKINDDGLKVKILDNGRGLEDKIKSYRRVTK
jgi:hypothetical protein